MVAGDIVADVVGASGVLTFQPAVGVGICITSYGGWSMNSVLTDGVNTCLISTGLNVSPNNNSKKLMIDNAHYITMTGAAFGVHYSGIQIK